MTRGVWQSVCRILWWFTRTCIFAFFGGPLLLGFERSLRKTPPVSQFLCLEDIVVGLLPFLLPTGVVAAVSGSFKRGATAGAVLLLLPCFLWCNPRDYTLANFGLLLAVSASYGAVFGAVTSLCRLGVGRRKNRGEP